MENMKSSENNNFKFFNRNPIQFLAGIYVYLIIVVIIVGLIYVYNLNDITTLTVPPRLNSQIVEKDLPMQDAKIIPPMDVFSLIEPSPEFIEKGKELYSQSCSSCHGNSGKGDGAAGETLTPKPRDFTNSVGWKNGKKLNDMYKTLEEGIPGSGMASYSYFLPEDKLALSAFIRSAFIQNAPKVTGDDLINLDMNYNLSQGVSLPAQIPVAVATKLIVSDKIETAKKINNIISSIKKMNDTEGRKLFYKVTDNPFAALVTLNSDLNWKKNQKLFVSVIVNDAINNGFNGYVFQLTSKQWDSLFRFLSGQIQ